MFSQNNDFYNLNTYFLRCLETLTPFSFIIYSYSLLNVLLLIWLVSLPQQVIRNVFQLSLVRSLSHSNTITFLAVCLRCRHYYLLCENHQILGNFAAPQGRNKAMSTPQVTLLRSYSRLWYVQMWHANFLFPFSGLFGHDQNIKYCLFSWSF